MCSTGVLRWLLVLCVDVMDSEDDNREVAPGLGSTVDVGDVMVSGSLAVGFYAVSPVPVHTEKKF